MSLKPLLFLSPRVPWPLNTGAKIRTWALLKALGGAFDVHYAGFLQPELDPGEARERLRLCRAADLHPEGARTAPGKAWLALRTLGGRWPVTVAKYHRAALARSVGRWMRENPGGLVHADHIHMAPYLDAGPAGGKIVDEHNVESQILERMAERYHRAALRPYARLQARRMRVFETAAISRADRVLAVSEEDRRRMEAMAPQARVQVVPNGVDLEYFTSGPGETPPVPGRLIFTGSMNWLPNEDAMIYFGREVFGRLGSVNGASSDWSLDIVGHAPSPAVRGLDGGRVRVTGSVEDVRPYMRRASIFVAPLRIGGGSRLKILEAFAMGVPVVSTSVGCEGLGVRDGRHLLIADTAEDFARAIARLGSSPALGRELTDHALRHAHENFSWAAIGRRLVELYESAF